MPMKAEYFLDTNVLIYAALGSGPKMMKRTIAADLMAKSRFGTSTQVIQEFYTNVIREVERPLAPAEAAEWIAALEQQPCATVDKSLIQIAIETSWRYRINYWDAAILAAAERLETVIVYSEDLSHGQSYGSIRVINPFL
jgi:predicted nucleic acid-binding protein